MTFLTSTFTSASLGCKDVAGGAFVIEKTVHYIDKTSLSRRYLFTFMEVKLFNLLSTCRSKCLRQKEN